MSDTVVPDDLRIKELFKAALAELWEEKRSDIQELLAEVIEDAWLMEKIDDGMQTETVNRADVFRILRKQL